MASSLSTEDIGIWSSDSRTRSQRFLSPDDAVFSRVSSVCAAQDDEEALTWAALEKLPTYNRLRTGFLKTVAENGTISHEEVDVSSLNFAQKRQFIDKILRDIEEDNHEFFLKLRKRIDNVGIELPKVEVRYEHLNIEADVHVGNRALPTLYNFTVDILEGIFSFLLPARKTALNILHNVSGIIKPSRMTLLLGPPGSGKTTMLLALAGKLSSDLRVSGKVTYNGYEMTEFIPQRSSAYISQHDVQLSDLTVRETLDFSGRCQGVGSKYEMLLELLRREKTAGIKPDSDADIFMKASAIEGQETNIVTDYVLKILGLDICSDTLVGDQMKRGISGGQKKRMTTGEMLVGPAKAFFMDDISTGLDSSTTYQIVKCLRHIVHLMDTTVLISLLQPSPETFELFDDIILLSEGHIVYHGPRETVVEFFESMGFRCPERKSVADFLQEVTSRKDQEQYWVDRTQPYRYVSVNEFSDSFQSFHVGQQMKKELAVPFDKSASHPAALSFRKYGINKKDLFKACLWRELILMKRNSFLYVFKTCQLLLVALITMTVFFRTELHQNTVADGELYMGALFYGLVVVMFNGFAEMAMVVSRLPVYYKQREQLFYPAWAYAIPNIILGMPFSLAGSLIWACLTYYVIGFSPEPERFFRQFLLLFCLSQMALGLFRFLGSIGRTMTIASTFGTFTLMIAFVMGGFVISKDHIPDWWIWAYWISPIMYGQNCLVINEFLADRWKKPYNGSIDARTVGIAVLRSRGLNTDEHWYWIGIGTLIGLAILYNIMFIMALAYLKPLSRPQAIVSEEKLRDRKNKLPINYREPNARRGTTELANVKPTSIIPQKTVSHSIDLESKGELERQGMVLPFQQLSISFNSVSYYIDMPSEMRKHGITEQKLQLLHDVSGAFRPGILTALVGVSGAGKTTLMDVLAGRKTGGYIEGDIRISGYPKKQDSFARISGYCEQNDIHSPNVTVIESLIYSAWLRLPNELSKRTRKMFVEEVMDLIELSSIKDALVGLPGVSGLSTEQRKRLTIAVELIANPSIIFMDEPTSGLDARAAAIVMRTVRNTVNTGRTVVCTIHQPSIDIFEAFDELLLLKRGGKVIYAGQLGHQSHKLIDYFQSIPGVPKIKEGYNPATWMLDISSTSAEARLGVDFALIYKVSELYKRNQQLVEDLSTPSSGSTDLTFATKYCQSFWEQCKACLWKQHWSYWRNPHYNAVRLMFTAAVALLFGSVFWKLGQKRQRVQDLIDLIGAMYAATLFLGFSNTSTVEPVVGIERTVFYRERGAGMYSALAYAFAQAGIEFPYVFVQTILYVLIVYSMIGFEWTAIKFFYFLFFMFFAFLIFTYYGMMSVAVTPNVHFATIVSAAFFSFWNLFAGFIIPRVRIPIWWRWYYWGNPISWTLYGLIGSQLADVDTLVDNPDIVGMKQTVKEYVQQSLGYTYDFLGVVAGVHVGVTALFIFIFAFGIKKLNFQRR